MDRMKSLKIICSLVCFLLLASQVSSMLHWNEARGVFDDICYLRQAHLFQRFGLKGFDTDISRDDDGYLAAKLKEINFPADEPPPCHTPMPLANKLVIQYPPGTGMALAIFPAGHQVVPLFVSATIVVFGFALLGIRAAPSSASLAAAGVLGCLAVYIMINPVKASYSMAPTMAICAVAGFLTAKLFAGTQRDSQVWLTILLGFLLGFSVSFRLPNLFLSAGYFLFFLVALLSSRRPWTAMRGIAFGLAYLVGLSPTLVANIINAGSPLATTYGAPDVLAPDFSFSIILQYVADMQFVLLALAGASIAWLLGTRGDAGIRRVVLVTMANMIFNLAFFMSHPVFTPYYTIPIAMLSLWSLSFAALMRPAEAVDEGLVGRPASARS
ncbi:MAG: hypothetical protein JOZ74_14255 [Bradyrhizobium sp.]|nr:hypothetical protein [Bradyrhizobium sp.]